MAISCDNRYILFKMSGKGKCFEHTVIFKLTAYAQSKSGCFHDGDQPPLSVYFTNYFYDQQARIANKATYTFLPGVPPDYFKPASFLKDVSSFMSSTAFCNSSSMPEITWK